MSVVEQWIEEDYFTSLCIILENIDYPSNEVEDQARKRVPEQKGDTTTVVPSRDGQFAVPGASKRDREPKPGPGGRGWSGLFQRYSRAK